MMDLLRTALKLELPSGVRVQVTATEVVDLNLAE
jgi:hypothetical protein